MKDATMRQCKANFRALPFVVYSVLRSEVILECGDSSVLGL